MRRRKRNIWTEWGVGRRYSLSHLRWVVPFLPQRIRKIGKPPSLCTLSRICTQFIWFKHHVLTVSGYLLLAAAGKEREWAQLSCSTQDNRRSYLWPNFVGVSVGNKEVEMGSRWEFLSPQGSVTAPPASLGQDTH